MIRLLYFSTARAGIGHSEVDAIVEHARVSNAKLGITGALCYNGRNFCQVLEGDEDRVRSLVSVIEKDDRHSGFKILDEKPVDAPYFPDWSMHRVKDLDFSTVINAMQG